MPHEVTHALNYLLLSIVVLMAIVAIVGLGF
jgi:hypothetical protein